MNRIALGFLCLAGLSFTSAAPAAAPPTRTVRVALPGDAGFAFKPGPGAIAAQTYCLTCHSSAYVSTQAVLSAAQWTAEVNKMRAVYGAEIPADQVPIIAGYLTTEYGKP
jgi:hypothetical protein